MERSLAAILAADVVGYSTMMGADEARALAAIRLLREELFEPEVARWRGVVVKRLGDGWLVEFPSVVDAVGCAVAVQGRMAGAQEVELRIGIHIGDIVHEDGDIYGDGVNIAARLEAAGAPGHVLISDDVRRQIAGRVDATFHDNGPVTLKNIAEPVRVWSWPAALADLAEAADRTGRKPGVHVALFAARGADAEALAEAVRDDLATTFARQTGLILIADKGTADYIVAGAIRTSGGRWRINARLTDRTSDVRVWSRRYDEVGDDLFDLQDRCVFQIADSVRMQIPRHLAKKSTERPLESMTVQELLNHAMGHNFTPTRASWDRAIPLLKAVLERDPSNWMAMAMRCWNLLASERLFGWRESTTTVIRRARELIERAQQLNPNSDVVHMTHGTLLLFAMRDLRAARIEAEQSLKLNSNFHHAIVLMSQIEAFEGNVKNSMAIAIRAVDCDPAHPYLYLFQRSAGCAYAVGGDFAQAADCFQRADRAAPGLPPHLIGLAACRQLAGDADGARAAMATLLDVAPDFNLAELAPWPFLDPADWAPFQDALAAAGAPLQPSLRVVDGGAA